MNLRYGAHREIDQRSREELNGNLDAIIKLEGSGGKEVQEEVIDVVEVIKILHSTGDDFGRHRNRNIFAICGDVGELCAADLTVAALVQRQAS